MAHILVAYATKHHSTQEIAEAIATVLNERGHDADCRDAAEATTEGYDAVVLGSAVYMGRWRREAKHFLTHERYRLAAMPLWIFSTGPIGDGGDDPAQQQKWVEPAAIVALADEIGANEHVVFGGRVPRDPKGPLEHAVTRNTPAELSDLRDWTEIRAWADTIADTLIAHHV